MIGRLLTLAAISGAMLAGVVVATREPSDAVSVAALLFGVAVFAFALATATFYSLARLASRRRRPLGTVALRRGAIVGLGVFILGVLRALDALSAVTAAFLIAGLAALEGVLSARG